MPGLFINTQKKRMIWLEILLLSSLCLTQYHSISSLNILITAMIGIYMLLTRELSDTTIALLIAIPMFNIFCAEPQNNISLYYIYIIIFWYKYFKHHHWHISKEKVLVLVAFLAIRLTSGDVYSTIRWFMLFSVFVLTYNEPCLNGQLQKIVKYLSITFIISSIFGYLMLQNDILLYSTGVVYNDGVSTLRFEGLLGDAVFFSQFCALLVGANLAFGFYNKSYLPNGIFYSAIITVFCLFSYARTGLFLIAVEIVFVIIWQVVKNIIHKKHLLFTAIMLLAFIVAVFLFVHFILTDTSNVIVQNYLVRFSTGDPFTGRVEIWKHYIDLLLSSWRSLFCAMPQSVFSLPFFTTTHHIIRTTHNIYIEALCGFGLAATLSILIWIISLIYRSLDRRDGILYMMPMFVLLASGMTLHGLFEHHYYTLLTIAVACLTFKKKGKNNGK